MQNEIRIERARAEFAVKLAKALRDGKQVYYFDESRINNWSLTRKSFAPKYSNNYVVKN